MNRDNNIKRDVNPRETANFLSLVSLFYMVKVYIKGYSKGLETKDIYDVSPNYQSKKLGEDLEGQWHKEKRKKHPSISRALWSCYGTPFILIGIIQFVISMVVTTWSPEALSKLISYFTPGHNNLTKNDAIFYGCVVIGINFFNKLIGFNLKLLLSTFAVRATAAVAALIYRKSLRLSSESLSQVTTGKIVTILNKDIDTIERIFGSGNAVWIAVIQTGLICYLVYQKIGTASFAGIGFFLVVLPLQAFIGTLTYKYKLQCSEKTDIRLNLIREVLSASKIIKLYTWEKFFESKIYETRKAELKKLHKLFYTKVWITVIGSICSKTAFFLFIMTYVWTGHNVPAETVYYILTCFNDLEHSLSNEIPSGFSLFAQTFAMTKRIESVLNAPELPPKDLVIPKEAKIEFKSVDIYVNKTTVLNNIDLTITKGLNIVIGAMGSGKTTLLKAILKECEMSGDVKVKGRLSYASQEPWLFPSTIRNNILFGEEYEKTRYEKVLSVCSLGYDLDLLPEGDHTLVGESGINLSKGQQARINLARAVYRKSDIYLLDDCLASLDGHVSDTIFKECICGFLSNKIRIFVTNNNNHVQRAHQVIALKMKKVEVNRNFDIRIESFCDEVVDNSIKKLHHNHNKSREIYHEDKKSGRVPLRDYYRYLKHGGGVVIFCVIVALFVLNQAAGSYSDKLLSSWVTLEETLTNYDSIDKNKTIYQERNYKLSLYTVAISSSILLTLIKSFSFFHFIRMASISIHKTMVHSVINSTMEFFDTHFIGNVINRFTKDFVTVDDTIPFVAMDCFTMIFTISGGIVLLTSVNYVFLIESLVLLLGCLVIKQFCQPAGRNLERLHVIAKNPLMGHFNSTLEGLITIRASDAQEIVTREFDRHQNLSTSAFMMVITNFVALGVFMEYICIGFTTLVVFQFVVTDLGGSVGDVGLAITQSFVITGIITSGVITIADCENLMISVERVLEFTTLEAEDKKGNNMINWPKLGSIFFKNVTFDYANTRILNNVTFVVNPGEKLGIVGRTGAGKSSIISSLCRLYQTHGIITIDGVDIKDVSLNCLRSNISIIPQNPYLFPGTIRENLDPLKQHQDEQIWTVLKQLHLESLIDNNLNTNIETNSSFSAGQKQLLCLARVILQKNKIVVLDEATANVDHETEVLMQDAIQRSFSNCTMLVIAHKALAVANCSKIITMSNGQVIKQS